MPEPGEPKNEEWEQRKRTSGISRIVGTSLEHQGEILKGFEELFGDQNKILHEIEKSPEQTKIVSELLSKLPEFLQDYGIDALPLTPDHFHFLDPSRFSEKEQTEIKGGFHSSFRQITAIIMTGINVIDAGNVIHEAIHYNSFHSFDATADGKPIANEKGKIIPRRFGFSVSVGRKKQIYFDELNEVITEELAIRFMQKYQGSIPELVDELERINRIKQGVENPEKRRDIEFFSESKDGKTITAHYYPYRKERQRFNRLIDNIFSKNTDKFYSREAVFNIFVKAMMGGNLLEVARVIESTYGRGSFRRLGEETKEKETEKE